MVGPGFIPLVDLLPTLNSFGVAILLGVAILVLCEMAIFLGVLIGNLRDESRGPRPGRLDLG